MLEYEECLEFFYRGEETAEVQFQDTLEFFVYLITKEEYVIPKTNKVYCP